MGTAAVTDALAAIEADEEVAEDLDATEGDAVGAEAIGASAANYRHRNMHRIAHTTALLPNRAENLLLRRCRENLSRDSARRENLGAQLRTWRMLAHSPRPKSVQAQHHSRQTRQHTRKVRRPPHRFHPAQVSAPQAWSLCPGKHFPNGIVPKIPKSLRKRSPRRMTKSPSILWCTKSGAPRNFTKSGWAPS